MFIAIQTKWMCCHVYLCDSHNKAKSSNETGYHHHRYIHESDLNTVRKSDGESVTVHRDFVTTPQHPAGAKHFQKIRTNQ